MTITRNSKCPLCGSGMTSFGYSHSDGEEWVQHGLDEQQCLSRSCGLPVRLWESVAAMNAEIERLREDCECYEGMKDGFSERIADAETQIERLRSALNRIANCYGDETTFREIARKALETP